MKRAPKQTKENKNDTAWQPSLAKLTLPDAEVISEWFSNDHIERLEKIHGSGHGYSSYSVYEVYNSKGAL